MPIGTPPLAVESWLERLAESNETAAEHALFWQRTAKRKYRGQAWAFRTAADMVRQADGQSNEMRNPNLLKLRDLP